ncbi:MAG: SpoIIE family protein phosphatase [Bacteroidales bacterium]|nr:SpoIIE family protein phosphatase [Bacteroidales bacterium]
MLSFKDKYQFAKKEVLKIIIALSALMIVSLIYYLHIRQEALFVAVKRAEATLENTEKTILIRMGKIETIVNSIQPMVEYALDDPDAMFDIARHTVESSSRIMGSGIAFKEGYFPEKGRWFEVYVGYQKGDDTLVARQIGGPNHDYLQKEWFQEGIASQKGIWSDPYYDNAGGMTFLMTYSVPVRDEEGEVVGLIGADIAVDTFVSIIRGIKLYPNSFCTLVAGDGTTLVPPPSKTPKGKCHVFSEEIDGKNLKLTITIPDADMYKRLRQSTAFFVILALSGILTVFFIAYRSVQNLWKLNEVRAKEQHIEDELAIARHIQQSLLPSDSLPDIAQKVDISGLQVPAKFVGGDLYDYYIRDNKLIFCIGDVSGKGVPAALLMAIAHSLFRTISAHSDQPDHITRELNRSISDNNPDIMFITMFLGVLDLETGLVTYCNAGHNPPVLLQSGEAGYLELADNLLIGVEKDTEYSSRTLQLGDGDTLFLYTDGLTEAENTQKELFGEERALEIAQKLCGASAEEQIKAMQSAVKQFVGDAEQSDDLTLLAIRYLSTKEQLTLTNDIQELERLEPFLENFFNRNNLDVTLLPSVNLALEEALANVIMYAYPKGVQGEVTLSTNIKGEDILMEIKDKGAPFDPLQQQEANLDVPLEERQIGGLGIHLIKEIMDGVEYARADGKNVLKMRKKLAVSS